MILGYTFNGMKEKYMLNKIRVNVSNGNTTGRGSDDLSAYDTPFTSYELLNISETDSASESGVRKTVDTSKVSVQGAISDNILTFTVTLDSAATANRIFWVTIICYA